MITDMSREEEGIMNPTAGIDGIRLIQHISLTLPIFVFIWDR